MTWQIRYPKKISESTKEESQFAIGVNDWEGRVEYVGRIQRRYANLLFILFTVLHKDKITEGEFVELNRKVRRILNRKRKPRKK